MFLLSLPILIMPTASYCKQLWVWPGPFLLLNDDRQKRKYRIEGESNFQQKLPEETRANITASLLFTYYKHEAISSGFWGHLQHKAPTDQSNNFCNQQHIVCLPVIWFSQEECEKPYKKGRLISSTESPVNSRLLWSSILWRSNLWLNPFWISPSWASNQAEHLFLLFPRQQQEGHLNADCFYSGIVIYVLPWFSLLDILKPYYRKQCLSKYFLLKVIIITSPKYSLQSHEVGSAIIVLIL